MKLLAINMILIPTYICVLTAAAAFVAIVEIAEKSRRKK